MFWKAIGAVTGLGVVRVDYRLSNYHLVEDQIMLIDFDSSYILKRDDAWREIHAPRLH